MKAKDLETEQRRDHTSTTENKNRRDCDNSPAARRARRYAQIFWLKYSKRASEKQ